MSQSSRTTIRLIVEVVALLAMVLTWYGSYVTQSNSVQQNKETIASNKDEFDSHCKSTDDLRKDICKELKTISERTIRLEGKIETRSWEDKDGNKRYITEVIMTNLVFIGNKNDTESKSEVFEAEIDQPKAQQDEIDFF